MAIDSQRLMDEKKVDTVWLGPIQIILLFYFFWNAFGPAALAGFIVMAVVASVNLYLASISRKLQIKQMRFKDQRMKLLNELLRGIRVIKLSNIEAAFEEKVMEKRNEELRILKLKTYIDAYTFATWIFLPNFVNIL